MKAQLIITHPGSAHFDEVTAISLILAAGLILAVALLAVVYYHAGSPREHLFRWAGLNFVVLFGVPALLIKLVWRESLSSYGLRWGRAGIWGKYILFFGLVLLPVLFAGSYLPSLRNYYPIYEQARLELAARLLSIVGWGFYFFAWEFFFRGFLQNGLLRWLRDWTIQRAHNARTERRYG